MHIEMDISSNAGIASETPCFLLKLPNELITHLITFVPPGSHLNLARTCRRLSTSSVEILQLHREAYDECQVVSDLQPANIPKLLNSACAPTSPRNIRAWHVRSFEIWIHRASWADWKPFWLRGDQSFLPDSERVTYSFSHEEIKEYLEMGRKHLHLSESQIDEARLELQAGGDGFMKGLLISLCPRLRDIKVVKQNTPTGAQDGMPVQEESSTESDHVKSCHSLAWLKRSIWNILDESTQSWPPGFLALTNIAVGVRAGRLTTQGGPYWESESFFSSQILCGVLRLPNVESVYFNCFTANDEAVGMLDFEQGEEDEQCRVGWRIPNGCSSVKHLYLDEIVGTDCEFLDDLVRAPKELQSATFRAGAYDNFDSVDTAVDCLSRVHGNTLESLMFHGHGLHGYRCNLYLPSDKLVPPALRHVTIDVSDLLVDFAYNLEDRNEISDALVNGLVEWGPKTLEVFNVTGSATDVVDFEFDILDCLDDVFTRAIESGEWKNLKTIYLEDVEKQPPVDEESPRTQLSFRKAIAAGRRAGVEVRAISNRDSPKQPIEFPVAPDKYDLTSGLYKGVRPTDGSLRFDHHSGVWKHTGCGYCGTCEDCLELYHENVWSSLETERD